MATVRKIFYEFLNARRRYMLSRRQCVRWILIYLKPRWCQMSVCRSTSRLLFICSAKLIRKLIYLHREKKNNFEHEVISDNRIFLISLGRWRFFISRRFLHCTVQNYSSPSFPLYYLYIVNMKKLFLSHITVISNFIKLLVWRPPCKTIYFLMIERNTNVTCMNYVSE